jgi:hypothetical protein
MKNVKEFVKNFGHTQTELKSVEGLKGHSSVVSECLVNIGYIYLFRFKKWFNKNDSYTSEEEQILENLIKTNDVILKYTKHWITDIKFEKNNYSATLYINIGNGYNYEVANFNGIVGIVKKYDNNSKQIKMTDNILIQKILNLACKKVITKKDLKIVNISKEEAETLIRY